MGVCFWGNEFPGSVPNHLPRPPKGAGWRESKRTRPLRAGSGQSSKGGGAENEAVRGGGASVYKDGRVWKRVGWFVVKGSFRSFVVLRLKRSSFDEEWVAFGVSFVEFRSSVFSASSVCPLASSLFLRLLPLCTFAIRRPHSLAASLELLPHLHHLGVPPRAALKTCRKWRHWSVGKFRNHGCMRSESRVQRVPLSVRM